MIRALPSLRSVERLLKKLLLTVLRGVFRPRRIPPVDPASFSRILVIRQHNQLGDMLCVTPLLRALREKFPGGFLALMTSPVNYDVMLHNGSLDEVVNFDKRDFLDDRGLHLIVFWRFIRSLRSRRFDLVIVPATVSTSVTSDLMAFLTGARVRIGAGNINGRPNPSSFFYTHERALDWPEGAHRHQTERNLDIADLLSLSSADLTLELALTREERDWGSTMIRTMSDGRRPVVAYHVGAGKRPNRWPAGKFVSLIDAISRETGTSSAIISGPMDDGPVQEVVSRLSYGHYLIEKQSIRAVASCLAAVDLLVSNDTGIMHVGAAVGTPVLSLFGPTDPTQWAPCGVRNRYIVSRSGDMNDITVDEVLQQVRDMLRSTGA
jgi:ADP-heptose:LPS heptosyltransferase